MEELVAQHQEEQRINDLRRQHVARWTMTVRDGATGIEQVIPVNSKKAKIIREVMAMTSPDDDGPGALPERNDVKRLWTELSPKAQGFVGLVAQRAREGINQQDVERRLGLDFNGLKGVHNGLARICKGRGMDNLVETLGYHRNNRRYVMRGDVAKTVVKLVSRKR
jgi:hypothetical protein